MKNDHTTSTQSEFVAVLEDEICRFETASFIKRVIASTVTIEHYHAILTTLFHQTRSGPYTFALAAANCSWRHETAKDYLLRHAEEERIHWKWILDDLDNTGYTGVNPGQAFPHLTSEAFIGFNERIATTMPVARLAIASVLEGIGGTYGGTHGTSLIRQLNLTPKQASFFLSHGETDQVHMQELREVVAGLELTPHEWGWMTHSARIAGQLYRAMYDHESFS